MLDAFYTDSPHSSLCAERRETFCMRTIALPMEKVQRAKYCSLTVVQ